MQLRLLCFGCRPVSSKQFSPWDTAASPHSPWQFPSSSVSSPPPGTARRSHTALPLLQIRKLSAPENIGNILTFTNKCQAERPGEIVLLPVRHEAPAVPLRPEDDEGDCSTNGGRHEVHSDPAENLDSVVLVNTEQVHECQGYGYQHPDEAEGEEKLSCHEKC